MMERWPFLYVVAFIALGIGFISIILLLSTLILCFPALIIWLIWTHWGLGSHIGGDAAWASLSFFQCLGICMILSIIGGFFKSTGSSS